jgi:hypothetical protein
VEDVHLVLPKEEGELLLGTISRSPRHDAQWVAKRRAGVPRRRGESRPIAWPRQCRSVPHPTVRSVTGKRSPWRLPVRLSLSSPRWMDPAVPFVFIGPRVVLS